MEQHEFEIEISRNGDVKVHTKGVKGKKCMEYVQFFEEMLGPIKQLEHTNEFYEPDSKVGINVGEEQHVRETQS